MWDTKDQIIWLSTGLVIGTFIVYQDSYDEDGRFSPTFFIFLETLLLIIIAVMFYIYSRNRG